MLHIHRAQRADALAQALGDQLANPLEDPLAGEVVAVHTRGMERWLSQRLSGRLGACGGRGDGVCANIRFPTPRRLVADAIAAASGVDPQDDPWSPERTTWALLEVLESCRDEPSLRGVASRLGITGESPQPAHQSGRLSGVAHIADLFDRYAIYRPEMVRAWAAGGDADTTGTKTESTWQVQLWRALRAHIGVPGPAERMASACARLAGDEALLPLPRRLSLFGLTRLPVAHAEVLHALGHRRDVHLYILHPSPQLWAAVAESAPPAMPLVRRDDRSIALAHNELLASWGADAREAQLVLTAHGCAVDSWHGGEPAPSDTLLGRIQQDVTRNQPPPGAPLGGRPDRRLKLRRDDRSIQIHSTHGRARQVEVLHDAILHLLDDDPTLEPRDVIVMCPDVETFAPLIQASFGVGMSRPADDPQPDGGPGPVRDLNVRLADRALGQTNALIAMVLELLRLVSGRLTASQVLDFAAREPVRRRFRFDDEDLAKMQRWVADAGIRWGLDPAHRAPFKLERLPSGTWRAGLDRLLVGVTMSEEDQRLFTDVLPVDGVDSADIELVGRFAEFISRLGAALQRLSGPAPIDTWAAAIGDAGDSLALTGGHQGWQRGELRRMLADLLAEADTGHGPVATPLSVAEVHQLLRKRLAGRPTRANFRTGHLTVCTLHPMRSVPHRVVCLLGLDDGAFPRRETRDGDDLLQDAPHVGERSVRSEDRQLLLDALLSASERLLILYTGNDERTNARRPPAVPVGELLDVIDATARGADGAARSQVLVRHPLASFDPSNFSLSALIPDRAWSHDEGKLQGALALSQPRRPPGRFLVRPLTPVGRGAIELEDLLRFLSHPVRAFLRERLRVLPGKVSAEVEDALPVELDGLGRWRVGQRLVDACLAGADPRAAMKAEIARGGLPPGLLGEPVIRQLYPAVEAIVSAARALAAPGPLSTTAAQAVAASGPLSPAVSPATNVTHPHPVDVRVRLADGRLLIGSVASTQHDVLLTATYARVSPRQRLSAWVRLLAATASHPERAFTAATVGRADPPGTVAVARIPALSCDAQPARTNEVDGDTARDAPAHDPSVRRRIALEHLAALVDLFERGMREPLPLYSATSSSYAEAVAAGRDPQAPARRAWTSSFRHEGEDEEPEHRLVLGGVQRFEDLLEECPRADETGPGWREAQTTRLGRLACRQWDDLLTLEELVVT